MTTGWRGRWLAVGAWLVLAVVLRVATCFYHDISGDDATVALMAKHILHGEGFPVFFYRQTYIGSVTGFHLVPALFLFGPSVWLVRLNEVAWSLVFLVALYALGRRLFGEAAARAALGLGALSPFLLTYWTSVAEPHFAANTFGVVLLLLAVAALRRGSGPGYERGLLVFGLVAGLAWWQAFKALEIILPALLVLGLRDPWLPLRRAAASIVGGFCLGSLPSWLFYLTRGDAPGQAQRLFGAGFDLSAERALVMVHTVVPTLLGSYYWPATTPARQAALLANIAVYAAAVALAAVAATRGGWAGAPSPARAWGCRLLLLALVVPFAMLYASRYVERFDHETARYVLPVYIPLLLFAGALVAWLGERSRTAGAALLAALLVFNLWTNVRFLWPLDPAERARRAADIDRRAAIARQLAADGAEALYVDDGGTSLKWAFLWSGPPVSELTTEVYLPNAVAADAARRVAILTITPDPSPAPQLTAAGITFRTTAFGQARLLDEIRGTERDWRPVARERWRVRGEANGRAALADGDLATTSPPETPAGSHGEVVVDLGAPRAVARVTWWPSTDWEQSLALTVSRSADGAAWEPLGVLPSPTWNRRPTFVIEGRPFFRPRNGWLELRAEPRSTRFLRFAPVDPTAKTGWAIAELYVYEDGGPRTTGEAEPEALAAGLRARGLARLYADPATSARLAHASAGAIRTLVANGVLDSHGRADPPARLAARVELGARDGLLVPAEDAPDLRQRLRAAGMRFDEEHAGGAVLLYGLGPLAPRLRCAAAAWQVAAGRVGPEGVVTPSVVEARLDGPARLRGVSIEHPLVGVRHVELLAVAASDDGRSWRPVAGARRLSEWAWAGRTLFTFSGGLDEVWLPPTPARHLRLELRIPDVDGRSPITRVCVRAEPVR
jgi:hypothetical protein